MPQNKNNLHYRPTIPIFPLTHDQLRNLIISRDEWVPRARSFCYDELEKAAKGKHNGEQRS